MIKKHIIHFFNSSKRITIKFYKDSCLVRASGLAYSTLLALVPLTTIVYAFGGFDRLGKTIETVLLETILPTHHEAFSEAINSFTANSLATGTFGMIFFLVTSIFLINTIVRNFDYIWSINSKSNFFRRYATYTAILVSGSLLLGVGTSITEIIDSYISSIGGGEVEEYRRTFSFIVPYLTNLLIFFIVLIAIPSAKVQIKPALIGAVISSILFEGVKTLFKLWAVNSVRTSLIYGSLSIIPIFLVGLYLFWIIVLIGTEITFFLQHEKDPISGNPEEFNMEEKLLVGLEIFRLIASSYITSGGGICYKEIEAGINYSPMVIKYFISIFMKSNLILGVEGKKSRFIPAMSLDNIYLKDIVKSIYGDEARITFDNDFSIKNSRSFSEGGYSFLDQNSVLDLLK